MKAIIVLIAVILITGCGIDKSLNQTVQIASVKGSGTGVIDGDKIITACHVVEGQTEVLVSLAGNQGILKCDVTYTNKSTDVAILTPQRPITYKKWKRTEVNVGDKVYCVSFPYGEPYVYSEGYVMRVRSYAMNRSYIKVDLSVSPGSSGAGVYHNGKLIGIVSATQSGHITSLIPIGCVP